MDLEFSGAVALVTGSSRGIGASIAKTLRDEGCRVIMNGRNPKDLDAAADEIGGDSVLGDVSSETEAADVVEKAYAMHGKIDVLVCNVGSGTSMKPGDETGAEWVRMLNLNLLATTNVVRAARPRMAQGGGGAIVCISSICGSAALGAPIAYSAAKAALNSFVRGAARYLAKEHIRINALAPGNILFQGSSWEKKIAEVPDQVKGMLAAEVALNRFGTPEEVAAFAAFLCSRRASFATGALYIVDGGQLRA